MRILVIEDNADITYLLNYILEDEGHEVIASVDGSSLHNIDQIKPQVILMDELLGGSRGSELCKKLKADESTKHIRVILISAMNQLDTIAVSCGADAYIEKPFDIETLTSAIKKFA